MDLWRKRVSTLSCNICLQVIDIAYTTITATLNCRDGEFVSNQLTDASVTHSIDGNSIAIDRDANRYLLHCLHCNINCYKKMLNVLEKLRSVYPSHCIDVIINNGNLSYSCQPEDECYNYLHALSCSMIERRIDMHPIVKRVIGCHHNDRHMCYSRKLNIADRVIKVSPLSWNATVSIRLLATRMRESMLQRRRDVTNTMELQSLLPLDIVGEIQSFIIK